MPTLECPVLTHFCVRYSKSLSRHSLSFSAANNDRGIGGGGGGFRREFRLPTLECPVLMILFCLVLKLPFTAFSLSYRVSVICANHQSIWGRALAKLNLPSDFYVQVVRFLSEKFRLKGTHLITFRSTELSNSSLKGSRIDRKGFAHSNKCS